MTTKNLGGRAPRRPEAVRARRDNFFHITRAPLSDFATQLPMPITNIDDATIVTYTDNNSTMKPSRRAIVVTLSVLLAVYGCSQRALLASVQPMMHRLSLESISTSEPPQPPQFPLIIGAGQGTTGTRSIHSIMCSLGIPSVHFSQVCLYGSENTTTFHNAGQGIEAHKQVMRVWTELRNCTSQARNQSSVCESRMELIATLRSHVADVVGSGVGAIHDIPYTIMVPYIIKLAKETRGTEPIILLTERDPKKWAIRRVEKHELTPQLVCDDTKRAFDLDYCLESDPDAINLFKAYPDCKSEEEREEYIKLLAMAMAQYQYGIRKLSPAYRVNMFESGEKMDTEDMTRSIWNSLRDRITLVAVNEIVSLRNKGGLEHVKLDENWNEKKKKSTARKKKRSSLMFPWKRSEMDIERMSAVLSRKQGSLASAGDFVQTKHTSRH